MGFQVYNSQGQELQNLTGTAGGDLTGTYPNPTLAKGPTYVTSLPSSPIDGQEIYYAADATNGVIWHLRYRSGSSSSYKWEFVGGSALHNLVATEQTTTSTSYTDLATSGPSITLPLAGDYRISLGCRAYNNTADKAAYMSFAVGSTGAIDDDGMNIYSLGATTAFIPNHYTTRSKTVSSASQAITAKYKVNGGTGSFQNRVLLISPVRVG